MISNYLAENYTKIIVQIPENVELIAVSKTHSVEKIEEIYALGQRKFGENKVQELVEKHQLLPKDIEWHFIGHLQTNKVKYIAEFVDMIQSVDSERLLEEINKQAKKYDRKITVLLQVKIADEDTKYGLETRETEAIFQKYILGGLPNIEIKGLMGLATFTEDQSQIIREFSFLKGFFDQLSVSKKMKTLSMGMSNDFLIAIESGSNSVRVGSAIFGYRDYSG